MSLSCSLFQPELCPLRIPGPATPLQQHPAIAILCQRSAGFLGMALQPVAHKDKIPCRPGLFDLVHTWQGARQGAWQGRALLCLDLGVWLDRLLCLLCQQRW